MKRIGILLVVMTVLAVILLYLNDLSSEIQDKVLQEVVR